MIFLNYDTGVLTLPATVAALSSKASKKDMQVLLKLAALRLDGQDLREIAANVPGKRTKKSQDGTLPPPMTDREREINALSVLLGFKSAEVAESLDFWEAAGVIKRDGTGAVAASDAGAEKKDDAGAQRVIRPSGEVAKYSSADIANVLELRRELPGLIDECQKALGKVFSSHEVAVIVSMMDYLGIDAEFVIVILNYCRKIDRISIRYAEKIAYTMFDRGIFTATELEQRLAADERAASIERKVRTVFGLKDRSLTTKEVVFIGNWASAMNYDISVIKKAYEITIGAINEPSIPYTNAILEKWHSMGLRTLEDVERAMSERQKDSNGVSFGNSFDTEEFFNAALRRSLE